MPVKAPPPTRACEVCYTPVPIVAVADARHPRCAKHADVVRLPAGAPQLRACPRCGGQTFRERGVCSTCDPDVPPLRADRVKNSRAPTKRMRRPTNGSNGTNGSKGSARAARAAQPARRRVDGVVPPPRADPMPRHRGRGKRPLRPFGAMDGRIVPQLARALAAAPAAPRVVNGLRLDPDEPRLLHGPASPWQIGNRCRRGASVADQRPAREKALALMTCPGEWEVLAFYQHERRVKAAVWYLRHRVAPGLPAGRWEFARCWWERAAVMGRYRP